MQGVEHEHERSRIAVGDAKRSPILQTSNEKSLDLHE